jgi:hypothetical protein
MKGYQQLKVPNNSRNANNNNMNVNYCKPAETPDTAGTPITEGLPTMVELQEQKGFQQKQEPRYNRNTNNTMNEKEGRLATVETPTTEGTTTTVETPTTA